MLVYTLLLLFFILFIFLAKNNFVLALAIMLATLPSYLLRFHFGPLPTTLLEIMITTLFIVWITLHQENILTWLKQAIKKYPSIFLASSIFLIAATISIFFNPQILKAGGEWRAFYLQPFLVFLIISHSLSTEKNVKKILLGLIIGGLATSLLAIYQHYTGWAVPYDFWENRQTYRVTGWFGFPNAVGLYLAPLVPLSFYLLLSGIARRRHGFDLVLIIINLLFIPLAILAIVFAKTTGALVALIAASILFLFLWRPTRWPTLLVCLLAGLVFFFSPVTEKKQEMLLQDFSGQLRLEMWGETLEYLNHHPWRGTGLANYSQEIAPYRINKNIEIFHHPHNLFLTIWVNTGLMGVIGFVWLLIAALRAGLATFISWEKEKILPMCALSALTIILVTGLVDSPYIKNDLAIIFWLIISLLTSPTLWSTPFGKQKN
ncbi:MAG TPA: O-antigen ligase family protein [Patescibacteria group bacterium]|nr:O-antigen ligase family protein [Patescibacteria group bacterium]